MIHDMPMSMGSRLPSFYIRELDLPEIREWEVGDNYLLVVRVEMTGKENMTDSPEFGQAPRKDQRSLQGRFKATSVKAIGESLDNTHNEKHSSHGKKGYK